MKNIILRSISSAALCILSSACSSTADRSAAPPVAAVPVEKVSGGGGRIASAHVRANGKNVYVSGLVRRQSVGNPPPWAHVDVVVFDAQQKIAEGVAVNYMPRDIPHGQRGGFAQSHYTARLAALPAASSTVKVVFHSAHRSECKFRDKS